MDSRPDLLLVTLDTVRYDHVDLEAEDGSHTPTLAGLASRGTSFARAFTPVPITLPAHASLLTGTEPFFHGTLNNGTYALPDELRSLAEVLADAGWSTAAVVAATPLAAMHGTDQGFSRYDEGDLASPSEGHWFPERPAAAVTDVALQLASQLPSPRFLWVHYYDPHQPWVAPEPWSNRFADPYDAEIAYADAELGRLLDGLEGEGSELLVVVTSDHGEALGEHGEPSHGYFLHDATTRVPLIFSWPERLPQGRVEQGAVRLIDVMPSVLDLLDLDVPPTVQGTSLVPRWEGRGQEELPVYGETVMPQENLGLSSMRALRLGDLRLVRTTRDRLFDLKRDPHELHDVAAERAEDAASLAAELERYATRPVDAPAGGSDLELDEATRKGLEALGYVALEPGWEEEGADVYEHADLVGFAQRLPDLGRQGSEGEAYMLEVLRSHPQLEGLWLQAVSAMEAAGSPRLGELAVMAADQFPQNSRLQALLASLQAQGGEPAAARRSLERAVDLLTAEDSQGRLAERATLDYAASAAQQLGEDRILRLLVARMDAASYQSADGLLNRARFKHALGQLEAALADYQAAARWNPEDAEIWLNLAYAAASAGRLEESAGAFERSLRLAPAQVMAWARLAQVQLALGRAEEAAKSCRQHRALGGAEPGCASSGP